MAASQTFSTAVSGVLKAQPLRLVWCATAASIVTITDRSGSSKTPADIATITTALVVDRAPVMGGRLVVVLSHYGDSNCERSDNHAVRLLPPSSRDRRRLVFTLAIGVRTSLFRKYKTLRLRASSEREYVRWASAISTAIAAGANTKTESSSAVATGETRTSTTRGDNDEEYNICGQLDAVRPSLRLSQCETVATSSSSSTTSTLLIRSADKFSSQPSLTRSSAQHCGADHDHGTFADAAVNAQTSTITTGITEHSSGAKIAARISIVSAVLSCVAFQIARYGRRVELSGLLVVRGFFESLLADSLSTVVTIESLVADSLSTMTAIESFRAVALW